MTPQARWRYLSPLEREAELARSLAIPDVRRLPLHVLFALRRAAATEKLVRFGPYRVVNSFLPPLRHAAFGRLAAGLHQVVRRQAVPVSAYISVTDRCRYGCSHCSHAGRHGTSMSPSELAAAVRGLEALGCAIIGFTGGEPLMLPEFESLLANAGAACTLLFTSGDGLSAERAGRLRRAGLFGVAVSLDSADPARHDAGRAMAGAFDTAVAAIRNASEAGLYTMMQKVADPADDDAAMSAYLQLAARLQVPEIRLIEPSPAGRLLQAPASCFLSAERQAALRDLHRRTNRLARMTKVTCFSEVEHAANFGCGAGFQHLFIDAAGHVCPCDLTPIAFGNVREESVEAIWKRLHGCFRTPQRSCFLFRNADAIRRAAEKQGLPLPASACAICTFDGPDELPAFYRRLWREHARATAPHGQNAASRCHPRT